MSTSPRRIPLQTPTYSEESTARELSAEPLTTVVPETGGEQQRRPSLFVVPEPLKKIPKGFVTMCVGLLIAALLVVLGLNISMSNKQYALVELENHQNELKESNEQLGQQVDHLSSPQNVAQAAADMGMVLPGNVASIDLDSGNVTGSASAADKDDTPTGFVSTPSVASGQGEPAEASAAEIEEQSKNSSGADSEAGEGESQQEANTDADLNGGTIAAPEISAE